VSEPEVQTESLNGAGRKAGDDGEAEGLVQSFVSAATEHPELLIGAAFAGGFALALLTRRLGR
jgi:hypothetical protein